MTDPFDQFWNWWEKPPGSRLAIPSELCSPVVSLPETERLRSREAVNAAVEHWSGLRRSGRTVWTYLNDHDNSNLPMIGEPGWIKLFGSGGQVVRGA